MTDIDEAAPEYAEAVSVELDYVVQSVQRSLDRLTMARMSPSSNAILLPLSVALLAWVFLVSGSHGPILVGSFGVDFVTTVAMVTLVAVYGIELMRRRREIKRLSVGASRQVEEAKQTLRTLISWLDRTEMPFHLRRVMALRAATLDALVSEARSATSAWSLFLD